MELKNILGDSKKWKIRESPYDDLVVERENFLNFYKIRAIIKSTIYRSSIVISLYYKGCQVFDKLVDVENTASIPIYIEDFIKGNFKNLHELPKFIKLLDELGIDYNVLYDQICIKFIIPTKRKNKGIRWVLVKPNTDDIRELIKRLRCYLLYNWEIIGESSSIGKYCIEDADDDEY